jgi:hypothetical protein
VTKDALLASLPEMCRAWGSRRGERQQRAEEHREGGPEHEQTMCEKCSSYAADAAASRGAGRLATEAGVESIGARKQPARGKRKGQGGPTLLMSIRKATPNPRQGSVEVWLLW